MDEISDTQRAARALLQKLESLQRAGVGQFGKIPYIAPQFTPAALSPTKSAAVTAPPSSAAQSATARQAAIQQLSTSGPPAARAAVPSGLRAASPTPTPPTPEPMARSTAAKSTAASRNSPSIATPTAAPPFQGGPLQAGDRLAVLEILRAEVAGCTKCKPLAAARKNTVFGAGNINTRLCFFGEAPGADEDASGIPFVGRAGQLLDKIIEACTFRREDVYILNVLKCRPPDNRPPEPGEISNCRGYFERQLEIIRPEFICCLGATASKALLNSDVSIGKLRKKFHDYRGIPVICTYHPSYLLRNPGAKKDVWEDMQMLLTRMGIQWK